MRSISLTVLAGILSFYSAAQEIIHLQHDPPRISVDDKDGNRAVQLHGGGLFQKNSIRLFAGDSMKLLGTYDDFNFGGYFALYDSGENVTLEMLGDASDQFTSQPAFGSIWLSGRSDPTFFPFPGNPGQFISSLRLWNRTPNQYWDIGFQGHNRGVFPNNFTETELVLKYNGAEVANIDENGVYTTVSDIRCKYEIESFTTVLPKLMEIQPSSYLMSRNQNASRSFGFIAQNVQEYFPELVKERKLDEESYLMMNYSGMIPVAVKAIQELRQIISDQQIEMDNLRELVLSMSKRIDQLEVDMAK